MTLAVFNVLLGGVILLSLLLAYQYIIHPAFLSPLAKIPNASFLAPYTPLWMLWNRLAGHELKTIYDAHNRNGPIVRLGPNEISVGTVTNGSKTVYSGHFDKHEWFHNVFAGNGIETLVTIQASELHKHRRRMMANVYSKSYLLQSEDFRRICKVLLVDRLLPILQSAAQNDKPVEVLTLNYALAMDFVTSYICGLDASFDFLRNVEERENWLSMFGVLKDYFTILGELAEPIMILSKIGIRFIPPAFFQNVAKIGARNLAMCSKATTRKTNAYGDTTKAVVYEHILQAVESGDFKTGPHPAELLIAQELHDHTAAGHDTVAITLTYLMYEVSWNADLQTKLREELQSLTPRLVLGSNELPSWKALDALPFLDALINETLRLYPPAPGPFFRITPKIPHNICGHTSLPSGVRVSASIYALHRNEIVFPEPETYMPTRWLVGKEKRNEMFRWSHAFGSGPRQCLGIHFANLEMKVIVAAIYTAFETSVVEAGDMRQKDAMNGTPVGNKLVLRFRDLSSDAVHC